MNAPKRIQMTRQRPWRAESPDAVIVARPSRWGNPFVVSILTPADAVDLYRQAVTNVGHAERTAPDGSSQVFDVSGAPTVDEIRASLAGRDLACWCKPDQPCHADVLLELANPSAP